jgi:hypothetical protein
MWPLGDEVATSQSRHRRAGHRLVGIGRPAISFVQIGRQGSGMKKLTLVSALLVGMAVGVVVGVLLDRATLPWRSAHAAVAAAPAAGATGTPTFVVNGEVVVGSRGLEDAVRRQLDEARLAKR